MDTIKESPDVDCVLATVYCSGKKNKWFINSEQLDEYNKNIVNYKTGRFLDIKPHVFDRKYEIVSGK